MRRRERERLRQERLQAAVGATLGLAWILNLLASVAGLDGWAFQLLRVVVTIVFGMSLIAFLIVLAVNRLRARRRTEDA